MGMLLSGLAGMAKGVASASDDHMDEIRKMRLEEAKNERRDMEYDRSRSDKLSDYETQKADAKGLLTDANEREDRLKKEELEYKEKQMKAKNIREDRLSKENREKDLDDYEKKKQIDAENRAPTSSDFVVKELEDETGVKHLVRVSKTSGKIDYLDGRDPNKPEPITREEAMAQAEKEIRHEMGGKDWIPFVEPSPEDIRKRADEIMGNKSDPAKPIIDTQEKQGKPSSIPAEAMRSKDGNWYAPDGKVFDKAGMVVGNWK